MANVEDTTFNAEQSFSARTALLIALAAAASVHFAMSHMMRCAPFLDMGAYVAGTERVPFQYRALVAWLLRAITGLLPLDGVAASLPAPFNTETGLAMFGIESATVFGLYLVLRLHLQHLTKSPIFATVAALALFYVLPFNYILPPYFSHYLPYDMLSILVFALGIYALHRNALVLFYAVFAIGCLNRETTCFLTAAYLLTAWGRRRPTTTLLHVAAQTAIWFAIKLLMHSMYGTNVCEAGVENGVFALKLGNNLRYFLQPQHYPILLSSFGYLWIVVLVGYRKLDEPFLRRALLTAVPFIAGMLLVGVFTEIRIFGELLPLVLVSSCYLAWKAFLQPRQAAAHENALQ